MDQPNFEQPNLSISIVLPDNFFDIEKVYITIEDHEIIDGGIIEHSKTVRIITRERE